MVKGIVINVVNNNEIKDNCICLINVCRYFFFWVKKVLISVCIYCFLFFNSCFIKWVIVFEVIYFKICCFFIKFVFFCVLMSWIIFFKLVFMKIVGIGLIVLFVVFKNVVKLVL